MNKTQREQLRFVKILKEEFKDQLNLIKDYQAYLQEFYKKHQDSIDSINQKISANIKKSEDLLIGFNLVKFIERSGQLMPFIERNGRKIIFSIDAISNPKRDIESGEASISLIENFIKQYEAQLLELEEKEKEVLDRVSKVKKGDYKKILGTFVTSKEKRRVDRVYNLRTEKWRESLKNITDLKQVLIFNIKNYERMKSDFEETNKFNLSVSKQERDLILKKYNEINELFLENEGYISDLKNIDSKRIMLSTFISRKTKTDSRFVMLPMFKFLIQMCNITGNNNTYRLEDLAKNINFGEIHEQMELLIDAIVNQEFDKINKKSLRKIEADFEKYNKSQKNLQDKSKVPVTVFNQLPKEKE